MEEINDFFRANPFPAKVEESNIVKIKGHNFTGVYPSPSLMKLDARKCIIFSCSFLKKKQLRLFSHFSVILTIVKNEWLATYSQNAILNYFLRNIVISFRPDFTSKLVHGLAFGTPTI